jgi:hypothetical protein
MTVTDIHDLLATGRLDDPKDRPGRRRARATGA